MALTNTLIANVEAPTLAAGVACGISATVTITFSSGQLHAGGKLLVAVHHSTVNVPLHVQLRSLWVDANGVCNATPIMQDLVSNDETYGGSAFVPQSLLLLKSGQTVVMDFDKVAGKKLQVAILAASATTASAVSAQVAVWGV